MAFVPENAPLVVLTLLATGLLLALLGGVFLYAVLRRRRALAAWTFGLGAIGILTYGGLLVGLSLASEERTLAAGDWKYFCEVDCHLAYRVESVSTARTLGPADKPAAARGTFYIVALKTWFDERTISSWRTPARRGCS